MILPEVISKEPLGPAVRQGDDQWYNLVKWTHYAMVAAEEVRRHQGECRRQDERARTPTSNACWEAEGNFGEGLGLTPDWAYRIVKNVGNYGEVFDRNVGEGSILKIKRGINALWINKGLQYPPPIR